MKISVVIISYNQAPFLEETIKSVIEQSYNEKEVILIDGGSTDGSVEIIKKYSQHLTYWVSEKDNGQSDALIKGFKKCTGDIIGWINSDDVLLPEVLNIIAASAQRRKTADAVFFGGHYFIDELGHKQEKYPAYRFNHFTARKIGPVICQPGTFFGRRKYESIGGLRSELKYSMDYDLFCNLLVHDVQFIYTGKYHSLFRQHPNQKGHSSDFLKDCMRENNVLQKRYGFDKTSPAMRMLCRSINMGEKLIRGVYLRTYLYRLLYRRRITSFKTSYT